MLIDQTYGKKTYCNKKCRITPWQEIKIKTLILI